jgi:hypothetical protein
MMHNIHAKVLFIIPLIEIKFYEGRNEKSIYFPTNKIKTTHGTNFIPKKHQST